MRWPSHVSFHLRPLWFVPCLIAMAAGAAAQPSAVDDLRAATELLLAVHPRPHRYATPETIANSVDAEVARLETLSEISDVELARSLQRVLALVGDAHLAVAVPSFQPGARQGPFLLPLIPKRVGQRVFVDASLPPFPPGTELVSIQGQPIGELYEELSRLAIVDGDRPAARLARVERDFILHFHLARGTLDAYDVAVRTRDGESQSMTLPAVELDGFRALRAQRLSSPVWGTAPTEQPPLPTMEAVEGAQVLRLATFGVQDQEAYRARVDELLDEVDCRTTLVLDLRGNPGGLRTNGMAVLDHLIDGPYAQWSRIETRVRAVPERFRQQVTFPFTPPTVLAEFPGEARGDRLVLDGDPLAPRMRGTGGGCDRPVAIFVDDATNSAAIEMIVALLSVRPAVQVIGTETIGGCSRHVGEFPILFNGHTGIKMLMSLAELTHVPVRGCMPGRGIVPDIAIDYSESDFLGQIDPYMTALAALHDMSGR